MTNPETGTYQFLFASGTTTERNKPIGILFVRGENGARNLSLFVSGYGYSSSRCQTFELTKGSSVSYEIESDNFAIDVTIGGTTATTSRDVLGMFLIYGTLPTITKISD